MLLIIVLSKKERHFSLENGLQKKVIEKTTEAYNNFQGILRISYHRETGSSHMNYIRLTKEANGFYVIKEKKGNKLSIFFAFFLLEEVRSNTSFFINWLIDPVQQVTGGNIISIFKEDNNISIELFFDDSEEYSIIITRENFMTFFNQWKELYELKPQEILIFEENGKVWLEERNSTLPL